MPLSHESINKFFEANARRNHRSLVVMIGENGRLQMPWIHKSLLKFSQGPADTILWCHNNEATRRASQQVTSKKMKKKELVDEDDLSIFMRMNELEFIEYRESEKILGQTVDMLILQDFEALSPNLIAMSMEAVRGGGIIVLLLDNVDSIEAQEACVKSTNMGAQGSKGISSRYNKRLLRSLTDSNFVLFLNDKGAVLDINNIETRDAVLGTNSSKNTESISSDPKDVLSNLSKTGDQKALIEELFSMYESRTDRVIYSVTAARGRGKSAALGIAVARAINLGFLSIYVASPALENVKTVFEFVILSLEKLGHKKYVDFKIVYEFSGNKRFVRRIEFVNGRKQSVEYFDPFSDLKYHPDLLVIDEAAAIPMTFLVKLLFPNLIVMSTTVDGYEGTGRAFSVKLAEYLRRNSVESGSFVYKELKMRESIRYGQGDPVEEWLYRILLLEVCVPKVKGFPSPKECELFYVSRDSLFSGKPASEKFLKDAFSLFISSHYKNSPNDLQVLADSPRHEMFTLLSPVEDNGRDMPNVMCSVQVSFEGRCKKIGCSKEGNLIPWIVSEEHMDKSFLDRYGVRIVRIAVHPEYVAMGYGRRALELLVEFLSKTGCAESSVEIMNKGEGNILLYCLDDVSIPQLDWVGASFGLTEQLYNFWSVNRFVPVGIKQTVTQSTGEHSAIFMKGLENEECNRVEGYNVTFCYRFIGQLANSFRCFTPSLCLSLLDNRKLIQKNAPTTYFTQNDIIRIRMASTGKIDMSMVIDLVSYISKMYFYGKFSQELSILKESVLLMIGCQHRGVRETADALTLKPFQVLNILARILETFVDELQDKYTANQA